MAVFLGVTDTVDVDVCDFSRFSTERKEAESASLSAKEGVFGQTQRERGIRRDVGHL